MALDAGHGDATLKTGRSAARCPPLGTLAVWPRVLLLVVLLIASPASALSGGRLVDQSSPYLRQHVSDGIDWYPWGDAALAQARREDKLVFLSIGYATCHWCHVMQKATFADSRVVELLNKHFVSILIDREEHPDVDSHYMAILDAMNGISGWPANVILTPELVPLFGYTYLSPEPQSGAPGLLDVARYLVESRKSGASKLAADIETIKAQLPGIIAGPSLGTAAAGFDPRIAAATAWWRRIDPREGGFLGQGKFPRPTALRLLLHEGVRRGDEAMVGHITLTLDTMAAGAFRDQLGGLFHRYTVDGSWQIPHFEIMLVDNLQLARLYIEAYQATGHLRQRRVAEAILDELIARFQLPGGGFAAALDADSDGGEGLYYAWTADEIRAILGPKASAFIAAYLDDKVGRDDGRGYLRVLGGAATREDAETRFKDERQALRAHRSARPVPHRDNKAITAWNALAASTFALASRVLGQSDYRRVARATLEFVLSGPQSTALPRYRLNGAAIGAGFLEDYAFTLSALIDLYETDFHITHLDNARALATAMVQQFQSAPGKPFDMRSKRTDSPLPSVEILREDTHPSGNAIALESLLRLGLYSAAAEHERTAESVFAELGRFQADEPTAAPALARAWGFRVAVAREVVISGRSQAPDTLALLAELRRRLMPGTVVGLVPPNASVLDQRWPLLAARAMEDGHATAYVCRKRICLLPVTNSAALAQQLGENADPP